MFFFWGFDQPLPLSRLWVPLVLFFSRKPRGWSGANELQGVQNDQQKPWWLSYQCSFKIFLVVGCQNIGLSWSILLFFVVAGICKAWPKKNSRNGLLHAKGRSAECSLNHPLTQFAADCAIAHESDTFSRDIFGGASCTSKSAPRHPQTISLPNAIKSCPPIQKSVSSWHIARNLLSFACICQLGGN